MSFVYVDSDSAVKENKDGSIDVYTKTDDDKGHTHVHIDGKS